MKIKDRVIVTDKNGETAIGTVYMHNTDLLILHDKDDKRIDILTEDIEYLQVLHGEAGEVPGVLQVPRDIVMFLFKHRLLKDNLYVMCKQYGHSESLVSPKDIDPDDPEFGWTGTSAYDWHIDMDGDESEFEQDKGYRTFQIWIPSAIPKDEREFVDLPMVDDPEDPDHMHKPCPKCRTAECVNLMSGDEKLDTWYCERCALTFTTEGMSHTLVEPKPTD